MHCSQSQSFHEADALGELSARSVRLATVVQAGSRRRDVRGIRSRILLLLLSLRCPRFGNPAKAWYVRGGVARLGISGLLRAWRGFFGEEAPTERTIRSHLGALERFCAVVRVPGDWIPTAPGAPRLRHPDTILVLEDEREAEWWAREGFPALDANPDARTNPSVWRRLFRNWRADSVDPQGRLPFPAARAPELEDHRPATAAAAAELRTALAGSDDLEVAAALRRANACPDGRVLFAMVGQRLAFRRAAARLVDELERRTRIRNRPGWIVWAFREAGGRLAPAHASSRFGA